MDLFRHSSSAREDLGLLAVMDALADEEQVTQRELSRLTGLNLKKVNYCLHKLLEKGHVKFQRVVRNPDKRAYLYILTPAGFRAKSRLTYLFLKLTLQFYNQVETKLQRLLSSMVESGIEKIVLYGASDMARIIIDLVVKSGIEVVGVIDGDYVENRFEGVSVFPGEDLSEIEWDGVLITVLDDMDDAEILLCDLGVKAGQIWRMS